MRSVPMKNPGIARIFFAYIE